MDKTNEYEMIFTSLKDKIAGGPVQNPSYAEWVKSLRDELVKHLESDNSIALNGKGSIDAETLRQYIKISRDIRSFIFDNIDTHILTIEHLADQILCRRKAYERRTKDTTKSGSQAQTAVSTKATIEKQATNANPLQDLVQQLSSMSEAEREVFLKSIAGLVK